MFSSVRRVKSSGDSFSFRTWLPGPLGYLLRELPGLILVLIYIGVLPVILGRKVFKTYYDKLGAPRYYVGVFLFLMMMALPIKMLARWIFNLKYIVAIPEIFFNI